MTDRPILMSAPMVRALLDGRKTQTRRLAWRDCDGVGHDCPKCGGTGLVPTIWQSVKPGDRLWVRETSRWYKQSMEGGIPPYEQKIEYCADSKPEVPSDWPKRASIHMPRWASRLTLLVTAAKTERVQEISEEDAEAEGAFELSRTGDDPMHPTWTMTGESWRYNTPRSAFESIWCILHTKPGTRWEDNPEVVALTFEVHKRNIDAMEKAA